MIPSFGFFNLLLPQAEPASVTINNRSITLMSEKADCSSAVKCSPAQLFAAVLLKSVLASLVADKKGDVGW